MSACDWAAGAQQAQALRSTFGSDMCCVATSTQSEGGGGEEEEVGAFERGVVGEEGAGDGGCRPGHLAAALWQAGVGWRAHGRPFGGCRTRTRACCREAPDEIYIEI